MDIINQRFDFIELMPVPMSILDFESKSFVKTNKLFNDILKTENTVNLKACDIIKASDIDLSDVIESGAKGCLIFFKTADLALVLLATAISKYEVDGKLYFLMCHKEVMKGIDGDLVIEDFPYSMDIKNILENIPVFSCVLSLNKKEIMFANASCRRIFGTKFYRRPATDFFNDIDGLCELDKNALFNIEFNSVVGSKWFALSASYIKFEGQNCILILGKDISKKKKMEDITLLKATTDNLTKTYNRQAGIDFLNDYLLGHNINKSTFSAVYLSINGVKTVRDGFGLSEGDSYIISMVNIVKAAIRQTDIFARIDDTGFLILFPNCVKGIVENIMKTIENKVELINTQEPSYKYVIEYKILEITPDAKFSSDEVFKALAPIGF